MLWLQRRGAAALSGHGQNVLGLRRRKCHAADRGTSQSQKTSMLCFARGSPEGLKPDTTACWSCVNGKVVQLTSARARAAAPQCYASREEAQQNCKPTETKTCWVCSNGKVVQLSEARAKASGAQCYTSREEAQQNCKPKEQPKTCWVCSNGKVVQLSEARAKASGAQCYGSREEAQANCRSTDKPTEKPTPTRTITPVPTRTITPPPTRTITPQKKPTPPVPR